jgi:hypothetical protein
MQTCTVCRHPQRQAIEDALIRHTPLRKVGERFNVGYSAVARHQRHVLAKLAKSREGLELAEASTLLEKVDAVMRDAQRIAAKAEKEGDLSTALAGLRTITQSLALIGRITGEIQQQNTVQFHAHLHRHSDMPANDAGLELQIAQQVAEATDGFNPAEIARLRSLLSHDSAMTVIEGTTHQ